MDHIVYPEVFDASRLTLARVRYKSVSKINLHYDNVPLVLETPPMKAPSGLKSWPNSDGSPSYRYSIEMAFTGREHDAPLTSFFHTLEAIDAFLLVHAYHPPACSERDQTHEEQTYIPTIKTTYHTSETVKVCVPYDVRLKGFDVRWGVFDTDGVPIAVYDIEQTITKDATVTGIIQCTGLWSVHNMQGVSWKFLQMRVGPKPPRIGFAIRHR